MPKICSCWWCQEYDWQFPRSQHRSLVKWHYDRLQTDASDVERNMLLKKLDELSGLTLVLCRPDRSDLNSASYWLEWEKVNEPEKAREHEEARAKTVEIYAKLEEEKKNIELRQCQDQSISANVSLQRKAIPATESVKGGVGSDGLAQDKHGDMPQKDDDEWVLENGESEISGDIEDGEWVLPEI